MAKCKKCKKQLKEFDYTLCVKCNPLRRAENG